MKNVFHLIHKSHQITVTPLCQNLKKERKQSKNVFKKDSQNLSRDNTIKSDTTL